MEIDSNLYNDTIKCNPHICSSLHDVVDKLVVCVRDVFSIYFDCGENVFDDVMMSSRFAYDHI